MLYLILRHNQSFIHFHQAFQLCINKHLALMNYYIYWEVIWIQTPNWKELYFLSTCPTCAIVGCCCLSCDILSEHQRGLNQILNKHQLCYNSPSDCFHKGLQFSFMMVHIGLAHWTVFRPDGVAVSATRVVRHGSTIMLLFRTISVGHRTLSSGQFSWPLLFLLCREKLKWSDLKRPISSGGLNW